MTTPTTTTKRTAKVAKDSAALAASLDKPVKPVAASKPASAPAKAKSAPAAPKPKTPPTSRNLPRELVQVVVDAFSDHSETDQQRIANYLKIVTTGTDENGKRWWPEGNFPRPTHFSWDA